MEIRIQACPVCKKPMPHAWGTGAPGGDVDWTCYICLHAEIAALKRTIAMHEHELRAHRGERLD